MGTTTYINQSEGSEAKLYVKTDRRRQEEENVRTSFYANATMGGAHNQVD